MSDEDEIDAMLRGDEPIKQPRRRDYERKPSNLPPSEPRFASFSQWVNGIAAVLVAGGVGWIASISISTAGDVKVLLARPEPVPMKQYESDQAQLQRQLDAMQKQLDNLRPQSK